LTRHALSRQLKWHQAGNHRKKILEWEETKRKSRKRSGIQTNTNRRDLVHPGKGKPRDWSPLGEKRERNEVGSADSEEVANKTCSNGKTKEGAESLKQNLISHPVAKKKSALGKKGFLGDYKLADGRWRKEGEGSNSGRFDNVGERGRAIQPRQTKLLTPGGEGKEGWAKKEEMSGIGAGFINATVG